MLSLPVLLLGISSVFAADAAPSWKFDLKDTRSGIVALESIVVSPTLVLFFDRELASTCWSHKLANIHLGASDDPLQINGHSAWGALWDLETSTVRALNVLSNSFCASGALISNGSMASSFHCNSRAEAHQRRRVGQRRR